MTEKIENGWYVYSGKIEYHAASPSSTLFPIGFWSALMNDNPKQSRPAEVRIHGVKASEAYAKGACFNVYFDNMGIGISGLPQQQY